MAIKVDSVESFDINEVGDSTQEQFMGAFKVKTRLSFREQLRMDQLRRELLGPDLTGNASVEATAQASILAELGVRIVESPQWWKESKGGMDLFDENVLLSVWEKTRAAVNKLSKERTEEAGKAAEELRELREQK